MMEAGPNGGCMMHRKVKIASHLSVTITFMDMHTPPAQPPRSNPIPGKLSVIPVNDSPISFYRYLYNNVGEAWLWADRRRMTDQQLQPFLSDPDQFLLLASLDGAPAGFSELVSKNGTTDIAYFGLLPHALGRGIGPWLLDTTIRTGWAIPGTTRMTVNTCTFDHPSALPLYQKMGFAPCRSETRHVADPRLDGTLPRHVAPHIALAS